VSLGQQFGNVGVNTGIDQNLHSPSVPQSGYNALTSFGQAPTSPWMNQTPSLSKLYGMGMLGAGMNNASGLHALENQNTAQNNMNLGNMQSGLSQRGMGLAGNQAQFQTQQQQQMNQLLLGLFGNLFGNMMGMI
jgi:hypothetical protein